MSTSGHEQRGGGPGDREPALAVETHVVPRNGRWEVEIALIFADRVERRPLRSYRTRRQAEVAATWIERAAQRDIPGPLQGF